MRQIPVLVLTIVGFVAMGVAADADVETERAYDDSGATLTVEYRASDEGVDSNGLVESAFGIPFMNGYFPLFVVSAEQTTEATPAEMEMMALLPMIEPLETRLASEPATAPLFEEVAAVRDDGAFVSTQATANNEGVEAAAESAAGAHEVAHEAAAPIPEQPSLVGESSHQPEQVATEKETVSESQPEEAAVIAPAAFYSASDMIMPIQPGMPEYVATGVAIASLTGTSLVFFPGARSFAVRWLRRIFGLALFSRIAQEDILSHGRRAELFEFIKQNPGERIETTRRTLGISNGSMHYHLKVLSERNLIRILRDGGLARLYPAGPKINATPYVPAQRRRFVELLSSRPGVTQREAATLLGISERMASYHIQTLSTQGLVEVRPDGARKRLFLRMAESLTASPVAA